jgi:hypothetical protein
VGPYCYGVSLLARYQPRSATEILDASFNMYREHFVPLMTISAVVAVPPALVAAVVPEWAAVIVKLIGNLLLPIATGATALFIAAVMNEGPIRAEQAFHRLSGRIGTQIVIAFLTGLLIVLGVLLLVVPGLFAYAFTAVAPAAAAIEGRGPVEALRRSRALARGQVLHILGSMLLAALVMILLIIGLGLLVGFLVSLVGGSDAVAELLTSLAFSFIYPIAAVATALLYFDLRVRNEGADIEAMVNSAAPAPSP